MVVAVFSALMTPLGVLAAYIGNLYRKRIAELEASLAASEKREKQMLGILLKGSEDEAILAKELARVLTGGDT